MEERDILVDRASHGTIALLTLNRPMRLNALTRETVAHLNAALDELAADEGVRALIITGSGRGFCSGQDLKAADDRNRAGASGVVEKLHWQEQFAGIGPRLRGMPELGRAYKAPDVGESGCRVL